MKTDVFHLQIIPTSDILPQEELDESRTIPLMKKIKQDGFFSNPIIVTQIDGKKYLQLDGMNRFSSMKMLGYKSILVQVVDYDDQENVELSSWTHFFHAQEKGFFKKLEQIPGLSFVKGELQDVSHRYIKEEGDGKLCTLIDREGDIMLITAAGNLIEKIQKLSALVKLYTENIERDVLPHDSNKSVIDALFAKHPKANLMCVFPTLARHQIVELVKKGTLLPSGISRHIIKWRCMNVDVSLSLFDTRLSIGEQNKKLEAILSKRKFRLYEEPSVYFE